MKKKTKRLITIVGLLLIVVVGATFAYFQTNTSFVNIFNTGTYRVVTTEEFVGPENWAPGQEIPKTITSTNEGTIPAAVRVSYTEQWLKEIDGVETDITNQITNGTVIINLDNTNEWIHEGNYYYYKYILEPTDTTSSFIKSVTLNPNMNGASCTQSGLTQICEASNVALGATYKLTITKETVQADKYKEVWNTNVSITEKPVSSVTYLTRQVEGQITPGDVIGIGETEDFYVISSDENKTVLLAKHNLLVGNESHDAGNSVTPMNPATTQGYGLQSVNAISYNWNTDEWKGMVAFSSTNYWDDGNGLISPYNANGASYSESPYPKVYNDTYTTEPDFSSECDYSTNCYYTSGYSIAYYVEQYKTRLIEMGAPSTITGRLLSYEEANSVQSIEDNGTSIIFDGSQSYWLGSAGSGISVWSVNTGGDFSGLFTYDADNDFGVRPVIEILTSDI